MIASSFTIGPLQTDGRFYVNERHENSDGRIFEYEWLSDGSLDSQVVLNERAAVINTTLAARDAARAMVVGTEVPYTKYEFLDRFEAAERIAIRTFAKNGTAYGESVNDFMEMLNASGGVYMSLARPGIAALQALGLITAERAAIIGAD